MKARVAKKVVRSRIDAIRNETRMPAHKRQTIWRAHHFIVRGWRVARRDRSGGRGPWWPVRRP